MEVHVYICLVLSLTLTLEPSSKYSNGENILVLSFFGSKSYQNVYEPLLRALINRGHHLTIVSPIKSSLPAGKVKEINGISFSDIMKENKGGGGTIPHSVFESREKKVAAHAMGPTMLNVFVKICQSYYEMPEVKSLLKEKFDLILVTSFMNECTYGLVHRLNTSFIFAHPHGAEPWKTAFTGVPVPPSFVPMFYFGESDRMSFQSRVLNFLEHTLLSFWYNYVYTPKLEAVYRNYLGEDIPSVSQIEKGASLILTNRHFSLNYPRPQMPQMVEIAGMHCRAGEPLPKDLEDFIATSGKEGFIYFSMGSIVQMKTMPEHVRKTFLAAFAKLKQKVIWKWESETMEDLPKNVLLRKWLPQQDILAHPKIRLFITHGGLLSTEEAVYHAVPILGIPLYGDQDWNLQVARSRGFGLALELGELTEEKLSTHVDKLLNDPSFTENVKTLSNVFKDRPQKPLDLAVFSTEYVMRHKGAPFLRSAGVDLNLVQYFSLDVIVLLLSVISGVVFLIFVTIRAICCRKRASQKILNNPTNNKMKMKTKKNK